MGRDHKDREVGPGLRLNLQGGDVEMVWNSIKLWVRIAFANAAVTFVTKLIEQLGLLQLPPGIEMYLGALLAAVLAWLRDRYGDVLPPVSVGRRFAAWVLRVVGIEVR